MWILTFNWKLCQSFHDVKKAVQSATGARTGKTCSTRTVIEHARPVVTEDISYCTECHFFPVRRNIVRLSLLPQLSMCIEFHWFQTAEYCEYCLFVLLKLLNLRHPSLNPLMVGWLEQKWDVYISFATLNCWLCNST